MARARTDEEVPRERTCGAMSVHRRLLETDPEYAARRAEIENQWFEVASGFAPLARAGVTVIPVVVQVVHRTNAQNVSDAQIKSQIDVLNRDFRKTNPDVASLPAAFAALAADGRIEFELAKSDPQGNTTDGIVRTSTNEASFTDDDRVKAAATGGADPWPTDRYLNIWVCQLAGGLLGYAQFPGGPSATDGVVITHTGFGTTGTAAAPFNLGRTTTHEIGHWLNLRHIWGDDGSGCNGSDFVDDTPNAAGPNTGVPAFPHVTCNNGPNGDLFVNYMDYTDDAGMFMFTHGQVTRMQAALDGPRTSIGRPKAAAPGVTLKFRDDPITLKFVDDGGTFKFRDDVATLKFIDDPVTLKFRDDGPTLKFLDDGGTLKFRDDVKSAGLDKPPALDLAKSPLGDVAQPLVPGGGLRDPAAPFVLSTPHHSMVWAGAAQDPAQERIAVLEQQLLEYQDRLGQLVEAEAGGRLSSADVESGNRMYTEYEQLVQEYTRLVSG